MYYNSLKKLNIVKFYLAKTVNVLTLNFDKKLILSNIKTNNINLRD